MGYGMRSDGNRAIYEVFFLFFVFLDLHTYTPWKGNRIDCILKKQTKTTLLSVELCTVYK